VISGLDHVVVLINDIAAGVEAYELLLGRIPSWRSESDGSKAVLFTLDNMSSNCWPQWEIRRWPTVFETQSKTRARGLAVSVSASTTS
jgi:hypothetical protein